LQFTILRALVIVWVFQHQIPMDPSLIPRPCRIPYST